MGETPELRQKSRSLPDGKRYHVYLSHSHRMPHVVFASELRMRLEACGFVICFPQDDFKPELSLKVNTENAMRYSCKTIVALSKSYLQSKGCRRELELALAMRLQCKDVDSPLIPLVTEQCDLPDEIRVLQNINTTSDHWFHELEKSLSERTHTIPGLLSVDIPDDLSYHVFFSYRTVSPDKDWVRQVVERFEASQPKIVCAYHERDFQPGRTVFENINFCIRKSEKLLVILTPEFMKSEWTNYETEIAQIRSLNRPHDLVIIPVLLQECNIPERLSMITYLDATDNIDVWWPKLLQTVNIPNKDLRLAIAGEHEELQTLKISTFGGRGGNDANESWLIDIKLVAGSSVYSVVVADAKNKKLKMFSFKGKLGKELQFPTRPMFFTLFNDGMAYVTFPDEKVVRKVDILKDTLHTVGELPVPLQCSGIAKIDESTFVLCCRSKCKLLVLDKNGSKIRSIRPEVGVNELLVSDDPTKIKSSSKTTRNKVVYQRDSKRKDNSREFRLVAPETDVLNNKLPNTSNDFKVDDNTHELSENEKELNYGKLINGILSNRDTDKSKMDNETVVSERKEIDDGKENDSLVGNTEGVLVYRKTDDITNEENPGMKVKTNCVPLEDNPEDTDEECNNTGASEGVGKKNFAFLKKHRAKHKHSENRLVFPGFIATSGHDRIFVTDYSTKLLTTVFLGEDKTFHHRSVALNEPRGVTVHEERLYVAAGTVRLFSLNGEEHGLVPFHGGPVTFPRCMAIDNTGRYIAITHKGDGDDNISIYQLMPAS